MECDKFEQLGLLYAAGELDGSEAAGYEAHLTECDYCKSEVELYKKERESLFTEEMLGETPSAAVDKEILRVCADPRKQFSMGVMLAVLKKYAPVPVFLMLVMVAVGGYVRYHTMTADSIHAKYTRPGEFSGDSADIDIPPIDYSDVAVADSAGMGDSAVPKLKGSLPLDGAVPVSDVRD